MADSTAPKNSDHLLAVDRPRQAFVAVATENDGKGFIACLATEGKPGYQSLAGDPAKFQTPWYLIVHGEGGPDFEKAQEAALRWNKDDFGLTPEDVAAIVGSSMGGR